MLVISVVALTILIGCVHMWVELLDSRENDDADDYCRSCPWGLCFETPKSADCQRWRDEIENNNNESSDNQ